MMLSTRMPRTPREFTRRQPVCSSRSEYRTVQLGWESILTCNQPALDCRGSFSRSCRDARVQQVRYRLCQDPPRRKPYAFCFLPVHRKPHSHHVMRFGSNVRRRRIVTLSRPLFEERVPTSWADLVARRKFEQIVCKARPAPLSLFSLTMP